MEFKSTENIFGNQEEPSHWFMWYTVTFFLVHFDVPLGNLQLAFCFTILSAGKHNGLERYDNNVNNECLSEPLRPFSNKPALF